MADEGRRMRREAACPICGRPREADYRPFCSARCRDQDLINWLGGHYAFPAQDTEADEDDGDPDQTG
jgi:endogenous inhibitor of DNA gyrase (YacG/DUF329 family)